MGEKRDHPDTMKKAFIKRLAEYFVVDQAKWSIKLSMNSADAKTWSELRNLTPLRGYPTLEEAEKVLSEFLR